VKDRPIRIIFDECSISPKIVAELQAFYKRDWPHAELVHLIQRFKAGDKDPDWLARLQTDGEWIVVSSDKGKSDGGNTAAKLPLICQKSSITHIIISPSIDKGGSAAHRQAFSEIWPVLMRVGELPKGSRLTLRFQSCHIKRAELYRGHVNVRSLLGSIDP
jgi:hypothetical protein